MVDGATIALPDGKVFSIVVKKQGPKNVYVQQLKLNGHRLDRRTIKHWEIMEGGILEFEMGPAPPR